MSTTVLTAEQQEFQEYARRWLAEDKNADLLLPAGKRLVEAEDLLKSRRDEVEEMIVSKVSIMPEGSLKNLTDQEVRDLFAYLRASQPP